ncbi:hypothetical protein CDAR_422771 [Caerostris darwini]|uniref:Uncharacterized protein n=1 Tax=Caerostris darwini TaxID=1538125 RepID=A0AAV4W3P7_9ARAC|nr:hypothetical protein CDAR_422771 [Caerostris darwini]
MDTHDQCENDFLIRMLQRERKIIQDSAMNMMNYVDQWLEYRNAQKDQDNSKTPIVQRERMYLTRLITQIYESINYLKETFEPIPWESIENKEHKYDIVNDK